MTESGGRASVPPALETADEGALLRSARGGDREAFSALVEPHRRRLFEHAYRMLGSVPDADDLVQETLLRAWGGIGSFEERASMRTWLCRIATNACLSFLERRPRRTLPFAERPAHRPEEPFGPHPDSAVLDAVEYRQDRTIRYRMRTKTGEVVVEETAITWRVSGGHLVTVRRLRGRMARAFAGDFRATERCASVITWGGPDRCRIDRVNLPPGVALPPRFYTRCGPIDQP